MCVSCSFCVCCLGVFVLMCLCVVVCVCVLCFRVFELCMCCVFFGGVFVFLFV